MTCELREFGGAGNSGAANAEWHATQPAGRHLMQSSTSAASAAAAAATGAASAAAAAASSIGAVQLLTSPEEHAGSQKNSRLDPPTPYGYPRMSSSQFYTSSYCLTLTSDHKKSFRVE